MCKEASGLVVNREEALLMLRLYDALPVAVMRAVDLRWCHRLIVHFGFEGFDHLKNFYQSEIEHYVNESRAREMVGC